MIISAEGVADTIDTFANSGHLIHILGKLIKLQHLGNINEKLV